MPSPCAFCGRSGTCTVSLTRGVRSEVDLQTTSTCHRAVKFNQKAAAKFTDTSPCTNVAIACPICTEPAYVDYKYNLKAHFDHVHPEEEYPTSGPLAISKKERDALRAHPRKAARPLAIERLTAPVVIGTSWSGRQVKATYKRAS
jgi:hypothetical protein